jgi:hypothetical protein
MKLSILLIQFFIGTMLLAHDLSTETSTPKTWHLKNGAEIKGFFLLSKQKEIYIEKNDHSIVHFPLADFQKEERVSLIEMIIQINQLNHQINKSIKKVNSKNDANFGSKNNNRPLVLVVMLFLLFLLSIFRYKWKIPFALSFLLYFVFFFTASLMVKSPKHLLSTTDPTQVDQAFIPFKPSINTFWDNMYFHVESNGLADHEMMTGITAWQQQVPIPQCYVGSNSWSIPLNPVIATSPVPVNTVHFIRGALAIAVNGVPIFNPYTNAGVDAYLAGQLDAFGGHSGRADDYHYHIAPLHLYNQQASHLPIAYAFDGFAVYGSFEPDGSVMSALDANHGHFGSDGVYHYHGTSTAPYMIGNMVGVVTEDASNQIVPQAQSHPIRPATSPLNGATIIACTPNGTGNGYLLTYSLSGQNYNVNYNWIPGGSPGPYTYTYQFISPNGTSSETYSGPAICEISAGINELISSQFKVFVFPNPAQEILQIQLFDQKLINAVQSIEIYSNSGKRLIHEHHFSQEMDIHTLSKGIYFLKINFNGTSLKTKFIID